MCYPPVDDNEDLILREENPEIYVHLEDILVHMIEAQDIAIFKSKRDYVRNKQKLLEYVHYAQNWQVCQSSDMSNSGIPSAKANSISRTFPQLFTTKIPEEEQIVKDLQEIKSMQLVVQVIMVTVCIIIAFILL